MFLLLAIRRSGCAKLGTFRASRDLPSRPCDFMRAGEVLVDVTENYHAIFDARFPCSGPQPVSGYEME